MSSFVDVPSRVEQDVYVVSVLVVRSFGTVLCLTRHLGPLFLRRLYQGHQQESSHLAACKSCQHPSGARYWSPRCTECK